MSRPDKHSRTPHVLALTDAYNEHQIHLITLVMARGDKSAYTDKQKRQAEHIEKSYEDKGVSEEEAERRAWATVNKTAGGGKKSGFGRKQQVIRTC